MLSSQVLRHARFCSRLTLELDSRDRLLRLPHLFKGRLCRRPDFRNHLFDCPIDMIVDRMTVHSSQNLVDITVAEIGIEESESDLCIFIERPEPLLALPESYFRLFLRRDIPVRIPGFP